MFSMRLPWIETQTPHHIRSLGTGYRELEVGVLLPVAKEERELSEETVVDASDSSDGLRARVSVDPTFQAFAGANQLFPVLEGI